MNNRSKSARHSSHSGAVDIVAASSFGRPMILFTFELGSQPMYLLFPQTLPGARAFPARPQLLPNAVALRGHGAN